MASVTAVGLPLVSKRRTAQSRKRSAPVVSVVVQEREWLCLTMDHCTALHGPLEEAAFPGFSRSSADSPSGLPLASAAEAEAASGPESNPNLVQMLSRCERHSAPPHACRPNYD